MKRVLILLSDYSIGGTTLSLFGLLSKIDPNVVKVDILGRSEGYYKGRMPNCNELDENFWITYPLIKGNKALKILQIIVYGTRYVFSKISINLFPLIYWLGGKSLKTMGYDAVINYSEGKAYLNSYLPAQKKITWIHCDYRNHFALNDSFKETQAYSRYDTVVAVSEFAKNSFVGLFPQYAGKTKVIYNSVNKAEIQRKAKLTSDLDKRFRNDCFTMVSIGRLDPIKQFNLIPGIAKEIKLLTNKPFRWYIIGGGLDSWKESIASEIVSKQVGDSVIMLGEQSNVYPYIAQSNLLVHTSRSESFSLVVKEAKALFVPSMVNNYECATEFIQDGIDGMIVPLKEMSKRIAQIIETPALLDSIVTDFKKKESELDNSLVDRFLALI